MATLAEGFDAGERRARAYDVFNGDADGLCALHQLRLAVPRDAQLITGVKRDIDLLRRVPTDAGIDVTVLDVSLDTNVDALTRLLDAGARVAYYDHHSARRAFEHERLKLVWSDAPDVCSSLLVDRELGGRYRAWAIAAAFGDNLDTCAHALAVAQGYGEADIAVLRTLGRLINYNAYGEAVADLHVAPVDLYHALQPYADPLEFAARSPHFAALEAGYREDAACAAMLVPHVAWDGGCVYVLPCERWARRISGTLANDLAVRRRDQSFAILTERQDGSYCVSVRSGDAEAHPANTLCERFESGGGRRAAAGINALPGAEVDAFVDAFRTYFCTRAEAPERRAPRRARQSDQE